MRINRYLSIVDGDLSVMNENFAIDVVFVWSNVLTMQRFLCLSDGPIPGLWGVYPQQQVCNGDDRKMQKQWNF